jgi:hypothetical protein
MPSITPSPPKHIKSFTGAVLTTYVTLWKFAQSAEAPLVKAEPAEKTV